MRLRIFEAPSMAEALQKMRRTLGEEAVIVASQEDAAGVRLTAAVNVSGDDLAALLAPDAAEPVRRVVVECLAFHAVPTGPREALLAGVDGIAATEPVATLTRALEARYRFEPVVLPIACPLALVGTSGAGKTTAAVRLVAQALIAGLPVRVGSADTERVAGVAQLTGLLRSLGIMPESAGTAAELRRIADAVPPGASLVLDMPGINPFHANEVAPLADLLRAARAEPVLVLPAGLDGEDSQEIAAGFAAIGVRRLIVSRLDTARRLGGVLAAADIGLAFAGAGISPQIGRGVPVLSAGGLARVLLHRAVAGRGA
jgi:flagellar biosynthesis protein FlhF